MNAHESRVETSPWRVAVIVSGVSLLLLGTLGALVCFKTGLQPAEISWVEGSRPSGMLLAILGEARYEVMALCVAALNLAWLLVRLHGSRRVSPHSYSQVSLAQGSETGEPGVLSSVHIDLGDESKEQAAASEEVCADAVRAAATAADRSAANADAQLRIATDEIERLRVELAACRDELETARATRSQFLANVSHELRTPMNGIIGMTDLLVSGELPARERRFAHSIAVSSNLLLGTITDLLDFSGIESGTLSLERSQFRIRDAAEDVCAMLAERAHEKNVELMCYVDDNVPVLAIGDASRLRQILDNLIRNAIAFTESGDVVVRFSRDEESGSRSLYRCDVEDTGCGISPEVQMTMFNAFSQEDNSSTRRHGGLGIGLAIVRELVTLMGGTISFRSRLGEGTRFSFTVELENVDDASASARVRSLQGSRVLVVDDNETNRTILDHQLTGWGVVVETVDSGEAALQRLHQTAEAGAPYDMLVLDLHMPGMDGIELARRIRKEPGFGSIRSLMLTSAVLELNDEELNALGIDRYVSKPPRQSVLHESLVSLLPNSRSGAQRVSADSEAAVVNTTITPGSRVLLAEDNLMSQHVGVGLLESVGCRVDLAVDGAEALELAQRERYDLILMDCRMPGVDGYAATRTIRAGNGENVATPIIALTANAMEGDRERCLDAGMSDYLAKPVRRIELIALLERWLATGGQVGKTAAASAAVPANATIAAVTDTLATNATPATSVTSAELPRLDEAAMNEIRLLQRPGKPDLLAKVIKSYLTHTPSVIATMSATLAENDHAALAGHVHTLKSSSAYTGAARVADLCVQLEHAILEGGSDAERLIAAIDTEFQAVSGELHALDKSA